MTRIISRNWEVGYRTRIVGVWSVLLRITSLAGVLLLPHAATAEECRQWSVHEIQLTSQGAYENPYVDVVVNATFRGPDGITKTVSGFWDGGRRFRVRFTPTLTGEWTYWTVSEPADEGLCIQGRLTVGTPTSGSRGYLRRDIEFPTSFIYDDGTRYFMWGTTHYHLLLNARAGDRWKEAISGAMRYGMNKARFSLTPNDRNSKSGGYSDTKPFLDQECRQLDLEHWKTADRVIEYMNERGFVADVILFWRMSEKEVSPAKREADQRCLRYALARYVIL